MNRLTLLICCLVFVSLPTGCRSSAERPINNDEFVAALGQADPFPESLVGTWKSQTDQWQVTFGPGGSISLIRHPLVSVPIVVEQGGAYEALPEGAYGYYVLGPCETKYSAKSRNLP